MSFEEWWKEVFIKTRGYIPAKGAIYSDCKEAYNEGYKQGLKEREQVNANLKEGKVKMSVHFLPERFKADNDLLLGLRLAFVSLREEKREEIISYINLRKFELSSVFLEWFQIVTNLPSYGFVEQVNSANEKEE